MDQDTEENSIIHPHILAAILRKITKPQELLKLQLVSKTWKAEVDRALKFADWETLCNEKLGSFAFSTIIPSVLPKISYKDYNEITHQRKWMKIFYSDLNWYSTLCNLSLRIFSTKSLMWNRLFLYDNKLITCLDVWSNYVAWGSTKGTIYIFANFFLIKPYCIIKTGKKQIKKIKFWFTASEELLLVSLDTDGHVKFWDVKQKIRRFADTPEVINGFNLYVNTSRNLYITLRSQILRFQLLPTSTNEIMLSRCDLNLTGANCRIFTLNFFEPNKISALVWTKKEWCYYIYYFNNIYDEPQNLNASNVEEVYMPQVEIEPELPFYSFLNKAIMYRGSRCFFALNNLYYWRAFHMARNLGGMIKSIAWHGNYLFFGLDNGQIHIHYIENLEQFEDEDAFDKRQPKIIELDSEPIIDLKIGHILDKPVIIAATEKCVYKIMNM